MRIELQRLGKTYDGSGWAVRQLDLTIPAGSIFGLIGPNGAGKTTALRMVATVMEPTEGRVVYDGTPADTPDQARELRRQIGFLGDGNPLYKTMTPVEYLRFFGQCFGLPRKKLEAAIDDALTTFSLTGKRDAQCGSLSKGMRQRLLIARCILHDPSLLILDEPADGLDPRGRSDLRQIIAKIRDRGVTVVISSHILRELDDLCDQVAILQKGKVVVAGDVSKIIDQYEVSRLVYELRLLDGVETAKQILAARRVLVEAEGHSDGLHSLSLQVQGDDAMVADLLAELVGAGVRVVTCSRVRSRLEDVYNRLSEDQVN
jgi:ABC-2 type transport system ATP-binding protein